MIEKLGCELELRREKDNEPFITDNGNYIFHLKFKGGITDPDLLNKNLNSIKNVKDNGLFLNMATKIIVGNEKNTQIIE